MRFKNRVTMIGMFYAAVAFVAAGLSPCATAQVSLPPFYDAVTKMPAKGKLGQVIKKESVSTPIRGAQAWRIAYITSDMNDRPTIATALVISPTAKAPADGRPVVSWGHGTTGTAQNCGPSQTVNPAVPLNEYFLIGGNSWLDYGVPALEEFIQAGYVVVASDYQGLGGGGKHQYSVALTQAHDTIDAIRAVGYMKETGAGKKAIIYGWSQGGGAAISAASAGDYIRRNGTAFDDIDLVGFVALAPQDLSVMAPQGALTDASAQSMMSGLSKTFTNNLANFTHLAMTMWATQAAFPERLKLTDLYTQEGADVLNKVLSNKCVHVVSDTLKYTYGDNFSSLMKPEAENAKVWAEALLAGAVPNQKPVAPVVIYWGAKDVVVPPVMGQRYRDQMCKMGGNVARVEVGDVTHFETPAASQPLYVAWMSERFAGKPAANGCEAN